MRSNLYALTSIKHWTKSAVSQTLRYCSTCVSRKHHEVAKPRLYEVCSPCQSDGFSKLRAIVFARHFDVILSFSYISDLLYCIWCLATMLKTRIETFATTAREAAFTSWLAKTIPKFQNFSAKSEGSTCWNWYHCIDCNGLLSKFWIKTSDKIWLGIYAGSCAAGSFMLDGTEKLSTKIAHIHLYYTV